MYEIHDVIGFQVELGFLWFLAINIIEKSPWWTKIYYRAAMLDNNT